MKEQIIELISDVKLICHRNMDAKDYQEVCDKLTELELLFPQPDREELEKCIDCKYNKGRQPDKPLGWPCMNCKHSHIDHYEKEGTISCHSCGSEIKADVGDGLCAECWNEM